MEECKWQTVVEQRLHLTTTDTTIWVLCTTATETWKIGSQTLVFSHSLALCLSLSCSEYSHTHTPTYDRLKHRTVVPLWNIVYWLLAATAAAACAALNAVLYAFLTPVTIFCIHRKCVADLRFRARTYTCKAYTQRREIKRERERASERVKKRLQNDNGSCSLHWGITT